MITRMSFVLIWEHQRCVTPTFQRKPGQQLVEQSRKWVMLCWKNARESSSLLSLHFLTWQQATNCSDTNMFKLGFRVIMLNNKKLFNACFYWFYKNSLCCWKLFVVESSGAQPVKGDIFSVYTLPKLVCDKDNGKVYEAVYKLHWNVSLKGKVEKEIHQANSEFKWRAVHCQFDYLTNPKCIPSTIGNNHLH